VVNNASAIDISLTDLLSMKKYGLCKTSIAGSFLQSKLSIPHLRKSAKAWRNTHILTLSPPLNLNPG